MAHDIMWVGIMNIYLNHLYNHKMCASNINQPFLLVAMMANNMNLSDE